MLRQGLAALALALTMTPAHAADAPAAPSPERAALVAAYAKSLGFEEMLTRTLAETKQEVAEQMLPVFKQFESMGISSQGVEEIRAYYRQLFDKAIGAVDPAEATRIYTAILAEQMSDTTLKSAIKFSHTEDGRRAYDATLAASKALQHYIGGAMAGTMATEMRGSLIPTLKGIVERDHERQKQASAGGETQQDHSSNSTPH